MADLKEFEQKAEELRVLGMKISVGQDTVYEHYWDEDCRRNIYSASKSFTSCAVGFAVQEGLIDLNERLIDAFAEDIRACREAGMDGHLAKPINMKQVLSALRTIKNKI